MKKFREGRENMSGEQEAKGGEGIIIDVLPDVVVPTSGRD